MAGDGLGWVAVSWEQGAVPVSIGALSAYAGAHCSGSDAADGSGEAVTSDCAGGRDALRTLGEWNAVAGTIDRGGALARSAQVVRVEAAAYHGRPISHAEQLLAGAGDGVHHSIGVARVSCRTQITELQAAPAPTAAVQTGAIRVVSQYRLLAHTLELAHGLTGRHS